ncbi:MAG: DNA gyrase subunit A, partial [Cyclobacteriaceae bacterium]
MANDDIEGLSSDRQEIIPINIEDEMRAAYIDYSMSVIVSRALPDARDGLKPVHRRILFGMDELGVNYNRSYKKCARIVGDVLGKYHPHGDTAVYDTLVRMAQEWSLRYPLVDGQGNFGSIDGDSPAAMRYTEARLRRISEELLSDIKKNTVDFQPNYDDSASEPTVLPAKIPNLLLNGASGIAVGMATNMPPHNLTEIVNGIIAYIDNSDIDLAGLMEHISAPDFPTGGIIYGYQGVRSAFETGRGRVVMRAKANIETTKKGKEQIIVSEIPYMVNKASMIEKTAALVNDKKIEGISDIRDESDREGLRIVYDLKRDAIPNVVLNNLFKYTQLQSSFGVNNVALVNGRPQTLNLKELIGHFVNHRHEVVVRRTQYDLDEAEKRAHILEGYLKALDHLDEVIALIRNSRDPEIARNGLMQEFDLSEIQAKAILEMRLQRLTGLEREKIQKEYEEVKALIEELKDILNDEGRRMQIIKDELTELNDRYGDERRTTIEHSADDFTDEDMIPNEEMVITISHEGYIKRTPLTEYRTQGRGGVGSRGAATKQDDFTEHLFTAFTHNYLLVFTELGKVFWKKVWAIPVGSKTAKGRAIQNLINIESNDTIRAVI